MSFLVGVALCACGEPTRAPADVAATLAACDRAVAAGDATAVTDQVSALASELRALASSEARSVFARASLTKVAQQLETYLETTRLRGVDREAWRDLRPRIDVALTTD